MSDLFARGKSNPCPTCGNDDGGCRGKHGDSDFNLCRTYADMAFGTVIQGADGRKWVCIERAHKGHTATFVIAKEKSSSTVNQEEFHRRRLEKMARKRKEEKQKRDRSLTNAQRHIIFSAILSQTSFGGTAQSDFLKRGYDTENLGEVDFRSVKKWQPINIDKTLDELNVSADAVPGYNPEFGSLRCTDGYLCPIRNYDREIIGAQVRVTDPGEDGGRYRWLSSPGASLHLKNGELPIAVFHPQEKPKGIALVEGVGAKPFYCSHNLDYLTIGAAGGQHLGSEKQLRYSIDRAIADHGNLPIFIILDAGWALNWQVKKKATDLMIWVKKNYPQVLVKIPDWNQISKKKGDIDEVDIDRNDIRNLSAENFLKKYKALFGYNGSKPSRMFDDWAKERVKLTADIKVNQRWLKIDKKLREQCDILIVRSPLGTGKTEALLRFLSEIGQLAILVGYRNSLLRNTINRANKPRLEDGKPVMPPVPAMHVKSVIETHGKSSFNMANDDSIKLWGGCADSFHRLSNVIEANPEYLFIHDEICSVLDHLKSGGTLKGRQQQAIEWDVNAIENSSFSVFLDANVCDRDVNFIRKVFPNKKILVVDNEYIDETKVKKFFFLESAGDDGTEFSSNPRDLPAQLHAIARNYKKTLYISDSQSGCEIFDLTQTKEGKEHFRLDRKTSRDKTSHAFQEDPAYFIVSGKIDSVSLSPSGESGLSIDFNDPRIEKLLNGSTQWFEAVLFDIRGTVGVNALTQLSARLRDCSVPIFVACPDFSNLDSNHCPQGNRLLDLIVERYTWIKDLILEADRSLKGDEILIKSMHLVADDIAKDPWFMESIADAGRIRFEHRSLKTCLKVALAQMGHEIHDLVQEVSEQSKEAYKASRETVKNAEAQKIYDARDLTWEETQRLDSQDADYDLQCAIAKSKFKHSLPGIEVSIAWTPELIRAAVIDDKKFVNRRWRLRQLNNEALFNATLKLSRKFNFETGIFNPGDVFFSEHIKIRAFRELGILTLLNKDSIKTNDPEVIEIVERYYKEPKFYRTLGITKAKVSQKSSKHIKKMCDRFLEYFGFRTEYAGRVGAEKQRAYRITTPRKITPFIGDIDCALKLREATAIEDAQAFTLADAIATGEQQTNHSWRSQQSINEVADMLNYCEDSESLEFIRACDIPAKVLSMAARRLTKQKQAQIKSWVIQQNQVAS